MSCVKTGANVLLSEYGAVVHGDLFKVGDCYILQFRPGGLHDKHHHIGDSITHEIIIGHGYLRKDRVVIVVPESHIKFVPEHA